MKCCKCGREIEEDFVWVAGKGYLCIDCFKREGV